MNGLRVAYVVNVFPKLSETFIAAEVAELVRRGVDVRVVSLRRPVEDLRHDVAEAVLGRVVHAPADPGAVLRDFRPQLVHAHFATEPAAAARDVAARLAVPFTFTAHGYDIHRRPPADFAERAAAAAAVVTVSKANARAIVERHGVPAGHVRVIHCGIDTERFRPNGGPADPPRIVAVARLAKVKNLPLLLQACAALKAKGLDFRVAVVGDGPERDELAAARRRLGVSELVDLVGPAVQSEVSAWWQRAAVGVLTSTSEGMPVSLMEAAACGVPVVATAVGGTPEVIEHGVTGLLTPSGDPLALAAGLERLLRDRALASGLGAAARQRAEERFSVAASVDRLLELWHERALT